jgi:hypothetical protein
MKMKSQTPKKYSDQSTASNKIESPMQKYVRELLEDDKFFHSLTVGYANANPYYDTILHNLFFKFDFEPVSITKMVTRYQEYYVSTWRRGNEKPIVISSQFRTYEACYAWDTVSADVKRKVFHPNYPSDIDLVYKLSKKFGFVAGLKFLQKLFHYDPLKQTKKDAYVKKEEKRAMRQKELASLSR